MIRRFTKYLYLGGIALTFCVGGDIIGAEGVGGAVSSGGSGASTGSGGSTGVEVGSAATLGAQPSGVVAGASGGTVQGSATGAPGGETVRQTPFRASVALRGGYDSNVLTSSTSPIGTSFTTLFADIKADLSQPRTALTIGVSGGVTYYWDLDTENFAYKGTLNLDVVHRAAARLTLASAVFLTDQIDPDFSLLISNDRRSGQYFYGNGSLSATYLLTPTISTVTTYNLVGVFYEDPINSDQLDRFEHYFSQQIQFLLQPTTTLVGEYRFAFYDYVHNNNADGFSNFFIGGFDQTFTSRFKVSIRGGLEIRDTNFGGTTLSPYGEGTLTYLYQKLASVAWTARYGLEQTGSGTGDDRTTLRTGIEIKHGFTPKLRLSLAVYYQYNSYTGVTNYTDNVVDVSTGVNFAIYRNFSMEGGYTYTTLQSGLPQNGYDRSRFTVGGVFAF